MTSRKIGLAVLRELMKQAEAVQADYPANTVRMWLFAHAGLTEEAEALVQEAGILWSDREQLDGLLTYLDLRKLPTLSSV